MVSSVKSRGFAALTLGALLVALASITSASAGPAGQTASTAAQATATPIGTVAPAPTVQGALPATPGPATQLPNQVARTVAALYSNVDSFSGTLTVSLSPGGPQERVIDLRHWFKQPTMNRLEVVEGGRGLIPNGTVLVSDNRTLTLYDPVDNTVFRVTNTAQIAQMLSLPQQRMRPLLEALQLQDFVSSLAANSRAKIAGTDAVSGRPVTIVELTPSIQMERSGMVRVALDNETLVPLRAEVVDDTGAALMRVEYTQFSPQLPVGDDRFTFETPAGANVVTLTPQELINRFGFQPTTLEEARTRANFTIVQPRSLPVGMSQQAMRSTTIDNATVVAFFYGTPQDTSTMLIERPRNLSVPTLRGAEVMTVDSTRIEIYEATLPGQAAQAATSPTPSTQATQSSPSERIVVVDWVQGDTALTLVTIREREDALAIVRAVLP